ncbi:MAG: glycosyltransferase family 2 protein, partial [Pedobacter sp.]
MEGKDLISVVIPIFNGELYVKACIENVLSQSYKNLEIIVVDDGSRDATAELTGLY